MKKLAWTGALVVALTIAFTLVAEHHENGQEGKVQLLIIAVANAEQTAEGNRLFASHKPWRICTEFLAKLVAAALLHWFLLATDWSCPYRSFTKTAQGIRALAAMVTCHLNARSGSLRRLREAILRLRDAVRVGTQMETRRKYPNHEQLLNGLP